MDVHLLKSVVLPVFAIYVVVVVRHRTDLDYCGCFNHNNHNNKASDFDNDDINVNHESYWNFNRYCSYRTDNATIDAYWEATGLGVSCLLQSFL